METTYWGSDFKMIVQAGIIKPNSHSSIMKPQTKAFTLIEVLAVIAALAIVAVVILPALMANKRKSKGIFCTNNLKQVGLALSTWAGNHGGKYPMAVSSTAGGAMDFLAHSSGTAAPTTPPNKVLCPGMAYMVMSNELSAPKVLCCPSDNIHCGHATNFSYGDLLGIGTPPPFGTPAVQVGETGLSSSKISYFVNGDGLVANPQDILIGDDNIGNATLDTAAAVYRFGASSTAGEASVAAASAQGCVGITSSAFDGSPWWSWTANDFHQKAGHMGMADGSCHSSTILGLHEYLRNSTNSAPAEAINFMP